MCAPEWTLAASACLPSCLPRGWHMWRRVWMRGPDLMLGSLWSRAALWCAHKALSALSVKPLSVCCMPSWGHRQCRHVQTLQLMQPWCPSCELLHRM